MLDPLQSTFTLDAATILSRIAPGCVIVKVMVVPVHPFLSLTTTVYVPMDRLVAEDVVLTLGVQVEVYGDGPPVAPIVTLPLLPLQSG